jgi:hypothetical protein
MNMDNFFTLTDDTICSSGSIQKSGVVLRIWVCFLIICCVCTCGCLNPVHPEAAEEEAVSVMCFLMRVPNYKCHQFSVLSRALCPIMQAKSTRDLCKPWWWQTLVPKTVIYGKPVHHGANLVRLFLETINALTKIFLNLLFKYSELST